MFGVLGVLFELDHLPLPLRSSCVHDEDDEDDDDDDEEEDDDDEEEEDDEGPDNADRRWLTCPLTWCPCAAAPYGSDDAPLRQGHHAAGRDRLRGRAACAGGLRDLRGPL